MQQAGKLDRRITLQQTATGKDASGGFTTAWVDVTQLWASVRNFAGDEREQTKSGGGQAAVARTEFTIHYRAGVTAAMRIRFGAAVYEIRHVNDWMDRHEFIVLTCDTGVANA